MKSLNEAIEYYREVDRATGFDFETGFRRGAESMFELLVWNKIALPAWGLTFVLLLAT